MRKIEMTFHENFLFATRIAPAETRAAIGYLAGWAFPSEGGRYAGRMSLEGDEEGNVYATYRNPDDDVTYTLFGLRDADGSYSFHS